MALLGNYSVMHKSAGRFLGGLGESHVPSNFNKSGAQRNRRWGAENLGYSETAGIPYGLRPPYCWWLPQVAGALVCHAGITTAASVTCPAYNARPIATTSTPVSVSAGVTTAHGYMPIIASANVALGADVTTANADGLVNATASIAIGAGVTDAAITGVGLVASDLSIGATATAPAEAGMSIAADLGVGAGVTQASGFMPAVLSSDVGIGCSFAAPLVGVFPMTAALDVGGSLTLAIEATGFMTAHLALATTLRLEIEATGFMTANLRSYTDLTPQGLADAVWSAGVATHHTSGTMGGLLYSAGGGSDPSTIAAAVWAALESTATAGTMGAALSLLRKIAQNRIEESPGNPGTVTLYDDDGTTPIATWSLTDSTGGAVTESAGSPARRVPT